MNIKNYFTLNRPLPSDIDMEKKLLSFIMLDNSILSYVRTKLNANHFYSDINKRIFYAICLLAEQEAAIDVITLSNALKEDNVVKPSYITDLAMFEVAVSGLEYIVDKIRELYDRREAVKLLMGNLLDMMNIETNMSENIEKVSDSANNVLKSVNKGVHALSMPELIEKTKDEIVLNSMSANRGIKGRRCGITDLDLALNGFSDELIVIGARPSMGKTTLLVNVLRGLSVNYKCLFFSMEQKDTQLITKIVSQDTKIDNRLIDAGNLNKEQFKMVGESLEKLKDLNLKVDERAGIGIGEIESAIIREKQTKGVDIVCIDYLQYMDLGNIENVNFAFTKVVKRLKTLTKKYNICIILLSQLSRAPEQRNDHHPIMSDLRDSGSIEQEVTNSYK